MAVFSAILALVIGSGFTALEYVKEPPAAPYAVSAPKTAGVKPRRILPERNPVLPIDGSNPAPVSNTGDADGQDTPDGKAADTVSIIGVGGIRYAV